MIASRSVSFFFSLVQPYRSDLIKTMLAILTTTSAILLTGYGLRRLVDMGFSAENTMIVNASAGILIAIAITLSISAFVRTYTTAMLAEKVTNDLRKQIFEHLVYVKQSIFERQNTGDLLSTLSSDIEQIRQFISGSAATGIRTTLQIIGASTLLVYQSPKLALYLFLGLPCVFLPILIFGKKVKTLSSGVQNQEGQALAYAKEQLSDLLSIKAFQHESQSCETFRAYLDDKLHTARHRTAYRSFVISLVIVLVFSGIAGILWIGAFEVINDRLTPGQLSAFVFYAVIVAGSVNNFADVFSSFTQAQGAQSRLESIFNLVTENPIHQIDVSISGASFQHLSLTDISFSYPQRPDHIIFKGLNLSLKKGETIALVGPSGGGKSTIFKILLGFYKTSAGRIMINDNEVSFDSLPLYRQYFSLVPQDPLIYHASILDNIHFANPDATLETIKKAMKIAHVDEFVDRFEQGVNTIVGDRGVRLSGGQRQRLALARALIRDADVLLLDEATNALDSKSEDHIQQAMSSVLKEKSAIIIAHRLSTIKEVDRIIMIGGGGCLASGTHDELLKTSQDYAKLAQQQFLR